MPHPATYIEREARELAARMTVNELQQLRKVLGVIACERERGRMATRLRLACGMPIGDGVEIETEAEPKLTIKRKRKGTIRS